MKCQELETQTLLKRSPRRGSDDQPTFKQTLKFARLVWRANRTIITRLLLTSITVYSRTSWFNCDLLMVYRLNIFAGYTYSKTWLCFCNVQLISDWSGVMLLPCYWCAMAVIGFCNTASHHANRITGRLNQAGVLLRSGGRLLLLTKAQTQPAGKHKQLLPRF